MVRVTPVALALAATLTTCGQVHGQVRHYPLQTAAGLRLHNVAAAPAVLDGKKGLRITLSDETEQRLKRMTDDEVNDVQARVGQYAVIEDLELSDGVITAEIAGAPAPGANAAARGFVGIAFRLRDGAYDLFCLRLTNGRAEDQERRNHATQYASHPDWPWFRLRKETPSKYEAYVDLLPDVWTTIRIDVRGDRARLFVHGQEQPTLIVNDLKSGVERMGKVALWVNAGTVAHFRNLTVTPVAHGAGPARRQAPRFAKRCSTRTRPIAVLRATTLRLRSASLPSSGPPDAHTDGVTAGGTIEGLARPEDHGAEECRRDARNNYGFRSTPAREPFGERTVHIPILNVALMRPLGQTPISTPRSMRRRRR